MVRNTHRGGILFTELIATTITLAIAISVIATTSIYDQKLCLTYYQQAIAMEIVDGEMEILAAGAWRSYQNGRQSYTVSAQAARNLPEGEFILTIEQHKLRLEWLPQTKRGSISREVSLK